MAFNENPPLPSPDWDILITGSGITQSLLAVALGRAEKSVLQIDKNAYYGGSSTAFYSQAEIESWAARVNEGLEPGFSNAVVTFDGELGRGHTISLSPDLVYWNSEVLQVLRSADMADSFSWQAVGSWWVWLTDEEVAVPAASGGGSSAMLMGAGVKAAKAVAEGRKKWNKGRKKAGTALEEPIDESAVTAEAAPPPPPSSPPIQEEGTTTLRKIGVFREVACTFEDVAWSKDLSDRDRGHLGEFLRFVMKHDSESPGDQKHRDTFTENKETSLQSFLSTKFPLPPSAITSLFSLTLLPTSPSTTPLSTAVPALARHFRSLGNIPDARSAAALTIAYGGSAELCQVLSRAAAVAGGVNVLARGVSTINPNPGPDSASADEAPRRRHKVALDNGEEITVDWIIGTPNDLQAQQTKTEESESGTLFSKAAYVLAGELPELFVKKYADEAVTPAAAMVVLPAEGGVPVYVLARSAVTGECSRGNTLLYASTTLPYDSIKTAVSRLLETQKESPKVLMSLFYTASTEQVNPAAGAKGVVYLGNPGLGVAFDDAVVDQAREQFERVVGTAEGFMRLPEEARRMLEEMEEA